MLTIHLHVAEYYTLYNKQIPTANTIVPVYDHWVQNKRSREIYNGQQPREILRRGKKISTADTRNWLKEGYTLLKIERIA